MEITVPCTIMRGGTSKGIFFCEKDLPKDDYIRKTVILKAFGSPDPSGRQIDGLGGATSTTSKVAIINKRDGEVNSVDYTFGQVDIKTSLIDTKGNCGNLSSAVGPFAIDAGLIDRVEEPYTKVHIYNTNTKKHITAHVPVRNGQTLFEGEFSISGVEGMGSKIQLDFMEPGGSVTGHLLPTGREKELLQTSHGQFEVSIVDAANPVVFVKAKDLGLSGTELPPRIDQDEEIIDKLLTIRASSAVRIGIAENLRDAYENSPAVPKICFVAEPQSYQTVGNTYIKAHEVDLVGRMLSMGKLHPTFAITGGICLAVASKMEGTVVYDTMKQHDREGVNIGHCGGVFRVGAEVVREKGTFHAVKGTVFRTARCLMNGKVHVLI